ncbi:hypothetical protein LCGC14_2940150 [marine sediment metagenome]|uniref:Uncharacterized protein n=1 Tax=marine sediment metagenome TaxID=412755 RepID=A0A0F8ZR00_9ZZZZ
MLVVDADPIKADPDCCVKDEIPGPRISAFDIYPVVYTVLVLEMSTFSPAPSRPETARDNHRDSCVLPDTFKHAAKVRVHRFWFYKFAVFEVGHWLTTALVWDRGDIRGGSTMDSKAQKRWSFISGSLMLGAAMWGSYGMLITWGIVPILLMWILAVLVVQL